MGTMNDAPTLLAGPEARRITGGISESTQRRLIDTGDYPRPVVLSRTRAGRPARVAWIESELRNWVARKIDQDRRAEVA